MQFPIVQQYKTDIAGINPDNQILDEPSHVEPGEWTRIIVPLHAPFFVDSLVMKRLNGVPLVYDKDFRIFRLMSRLTELCATPVACMIELLDETITDVSMDYKVVGEFSLIDTDMLQLITSAVVNNRPVLWDNLRDKPVAFPPILHSHSLLTDIVAWQDVIECMDLFLAMQVANGKNPFQVRIDHYHDLVTNYINTYSDMLATFLSNHMEGHNVHGLTATQVGKGLVDNFATATSSNVLQGRSDMHLTPVSLETVIDTYVSSQGDYLKASNLPVSSFVNPGFTLTVSGWSLIAANPVNVVFQGKAYTIPAGAISLVLGGVSPSNSTFYVYVVLSDTTPQYMVTTQKTMETVSQIWVATAITNNNLITSVTYFNKLFLLNGYRISEVKMGNAIPASSGLINTIGICPWIHHGGPTIPLTITVPATVHSNVAGSTLTVNGSTVGNGMTLTYSITQSGGSAVIFSKTDGIAANEVVTFTTPAVLSDTPILISVVAIDTLGGVSDTKTATVTVLKHNPPTVPTTFTVPATVKFNSTGNVLVISGATASDGATITYSLDQSGDVALTFSKTSGIKAGEQVTFSTPNITVDTPVVISVTTVDSLGFVNVPKTATTTILTHVAPTIPTVTVPATVHMNSVNNVLTISGSVGSDGVTLTYSIISSNTAVLSFSKTDEINAGEQVTFNTSNVTVDTPVSISAVATDSMGLSSVAVIVITNVLHHVAPSAPTTITVASSVYQGSTGNSIKVSGAVATDGATLTYSLTQTSGPVVTFSKTSGIAANEVITFNAPGVGVNTGIVITTKATDSMGLDSPVKSTSITITTLPTQAGTPYGGGYYIGNFVTGGHTYALIDAGAAGDMMGSITDSDWGMDGEGTTYYWTPPYPITDSNNGTSNTTLLFYQCSNDYGQQGSYDLTLAAVHCPNWRGGGYADWYLPSENEQEVLYLALAPGSTTVAAYRPGGGQTLQSDWYWNSSLMDPSNGGGGTPQCRHFANNVETTSPDLYQGHLSRPMRRVQIS